MKKLLKINLSSFSKSKLIFIYSLFIFFFLIPLSFFYTYIFIEKYSFIVDENHNLILSKLQFEHSQLLLNLHKGIGYESVFFGIKFYLLKLPFFPIFIYVLSKISLNIYFIIICKNIIFYSILFFSIFYFCFKRKLNLYYFFLFLLLFFVNPYNVNVNMNIMYADTIISLLLPCLFLILNIPGNKKYFFASILIFLLYLTKSNMFFLTLFLSIFCLFEGIKNKNYFSFLPIIFFIFATLSWGFFGLFKTGKFPFAGSLSSINSFVMTYSLNKDFKLYFPNKSTDLMQEQYQLPKNIDNEIDFYNFYQKKNKEYLKKNFDIFFSDILKKLKFIFFNTMNSSQWPDKEGNINNNFNIWFLLNQFFFNLGIIILSVNFFKKISSKKFENIDIQYFICLIFSITPLLIVWPSTKHLISIFILTKIYIFIKIIDLNER